MNFLVLMILNLKKIMIKMKKSIEEKLKNHSLWVMEQTCSNEAFQTGIGEDPYHYTLFLLAFENPKRQIILQKSFYEFEEVLKKLKDFSGKLPIILGRHESFPKKMIVEREIESYTGLTNGILKYYQRLFDAGISFSCSLDLDL